VLEPKVSLAYGPVPSRRLGRSVGINNIPPKICSYGCVYCQVGATPRPRLEPREMYAPERVREAAARQVDRVRARGGQADYLTFVPDGEPTLDANLGREIELLRTLGIPVAVITNGSLAWRPEVRAALCAADWVSVKVDAVHEEIWRQVDRAPEQLALSAVLEGIGALAKELSGRLVSETMLVEGLNDGATSVKAIGDFLASAGISTAYLAVPTRPPAEVGAHAPDEAVVAQAYELLSEQVDHVEYLTGYEGDAFASSGDARADLLSITAVHPLRESAVGQLLSRSGSSWEVVRQLLDEGLLRCVEHEGSQFYLRRFRRPKAP